jgi:LmbE family N-acetylglucosaminyl deacetylase
MLRAVARVKPVVPAAAWPVLTAVRSLTGDRPIVATPTFRRVVAIAAHPDDETAGCGGLLALLAAQGADITVVAATAGEATIGAAMAPAEVARRRTTELAAACRALGVVRPPIVLGHPDGGLSSVGAELARDLDRVLTEARPEAVLLPWFLDGHADHRAVTDAARGACLARGVEVWGYETWTPLSPNRLVDITSVLDRKEAALSAHQLAAQAFDVGAIVGLNRYRAAYGGLLAGSAEAYLAAPAAQWYALADG